MPYTIHAFYKFVALPDYKELQQPLLTCCLENDIIGTILLAEEGINGTIAGPAAGLQALWDFVHQDARFDGMDLKQSKTETLPFYRIKVRLKKEIVTLGAAGIDPTLQVGQYVEPEQWNELIRDPEVLLIDTRNEYETAVGTFEGAVDPHTNSFREFPDYVDRELDPARTPRVAMFCTGGIRCEKASALMLQRGFKEVYHLKGGILNYLEKVPEENSTWNGECFVFDNRVTVDHHLERGHYDLCHACRMPISEQDKKQPEYEPGVSCPACIRQLDPDRRVRLMEREKQQRLARERGERHLGQRIDQASDSSGPSSAGRMPVR